MRAVWLPCVVWALVVGGCATEESLSADELKRLLGDTGVGVVPPGTGGLTAGGGASSGGGAVSTGGTAPPSGGVPGTGGLGAAGSSGGSSSGGKGGSAGGVGGGGGRSGGGGVGGVGGASGGGGASGAAGGGSCKPASCPACFLGSQCCLPTNKCGCSAFGALPCG